MAGLEQLAALYRDRGELPLRTRLGVTFGAVAALHAAGVALLFSGTADGAPLAMGLVLTAYFAGVKHSYDWDHLAAIDNATRKFVAERKDPVSVGFAFSLGHSSVVMVAGVLLVAGVSPVGRAMAEGSGSSMLLGLIGSAVSALFLLAMGLFNASACLRTISVSRAVRNGVAELPADFAATGFVARLLTRPLARVERPRHIYLIGFLFGLGFDTATTVGLLIMTAAAALAGISPLVLLALPVAFAAAMTLCDTVNGVAMLRMYRSALADPRRKLAFNAVITGISATSALSIATITTGSILSAVGVRNPLTGWLAAVDLGDAGLLLVAVLLLSWGAAALRWRLGARAGAPASAATDRPGALRQQLPGTTASPGRPRSGVRFGAERHPSSP